MHRLKILFAVAMTAFVLAANASYKDAALPIEQRIEDLLSRMTLEEKTAQLQGYFIRDSLAFDADGNYVGVLDTAVVNHGVGSLYARGFWGDNHRRRVQCINGIQKYMLEKSRLGIPIFGFGEALHGFMADGATSFPQAIALGCTWDTTLVEQVFTAAALEASARGTRQVLSPVLDLARDPRWGRTEECYGEDPYLVSRLGMAAVFGFQGRGKTIDKNHVAVTLKHFAGHGQSEGGRNIAPVIFGDRDFRENHLYPFEMAVKRAHAQSIMASYNEWDGVPNHANRKLLWDILRKDWGFDGYVMSDGGGLDVTYRDHSAVADAAESGMWSIKAGLDYELGAGCFAALADQVRKGLVPQESVDRAVRGVLSVKFTLGLFEDPYLDPDRMEKVTDCAEHRALALKAAHEAAVLLKNDGNTLPFNPDKIKTLAVIGPNAKGMHLGGYSATPHKGTDVLKGIEDFAADRFKVVYAQGCGLTLNTDCHWQVQENPILSDPETDKQLIAEAVETAKESDAVVLVLGENELICREAWSESHLGDRDNLDLVGMQNELAKAVIATGKPVAILLLNGRPIAVNELQKIAPAILECWYLGQETGPAAADLIFGKVNPSGKLTVTFPRSVGQIPCYYDRKPSRFRDYVLADSSPLYPFGFGLSYTTFEYKNLKLAQTEIKPNGTVDVSVEVTNTGKRRGDEIVQLYIRDVISLPTRPVKELKDFARISLEPGETRTVKFTLTPDKLEAFDLDMKRTVQPGDFEIMVGKNSADVLKTTLTVKP